MKSNTLRKSDFIYSRPGAQELDEAFLDLVAVQPKQRATLAKPKSKAANLKVYKSSPAQRLNAKVNLIKKAVSQFAMVGILGSALSYFCAISLEVQVSNRLHNLEKQMKNREDLKSYLGRVYSWQSLHTKAEDLKLVKADKIENATKKKSIYASIFEAAGR